MSKQPKTVQQMIDEVCGEICDRYCKWPSVYENENADEDKLCEEQCERCPLMRLR